MTKQGNIFLIGFMGAGKSTVAKELSRRLGCERIEMDQLIVEKKGMPISEIFSTYGEDYFRDIETQCLIDFHKKNNVVVSCGGGVVIREKNIKYMKESGCIVLLSATPETIYERVKDSDERPILNDHMNVEFIADLMEKRRNKYISAADIVIDTDKKNVDEICDEIIERWERA